MDSYSVRLAYRSIRGGLLLVLLDGVLLGGACLQQDTCAQTRPIEANRPVNSDSGANENPELTTQAYLDVAQADVVETLERLTSAVKKRTEQLAADTERSTEVKESLSKLYQQTQMDLETITQLQQQQAQWESRASNAAGLLESSRRTKAEGQEIPETEEREGLDRLSFEEALAKQQDLEAALSAAAANRSQLQEESTRREQRRKALPQRISEAKSALEQFVNTPAEGGSAEDALVREAMQWSAEAARLVLVEQVQMLELEQRVYEAETMLLPLQLELAQNEESRLQERVHIVAAAVSERRDNRITGYAIEFQRLSPPNIPILQRLRAWLAIGESSELPGAEAAAQTPLLTWRELAKKQASVTAEMEEAQAALDRWKEKRTKMGNRVGSQAGRESVSGVNAWVGLMLRKQRSELPDPAQLAARLRHFQSEIQIADSLLFNVEDTSLELKDAIREETEESRKAVLTASGEILAAMKADVDTYLQDLYEIADLKDSTLEFSLEYRDFIDKHVLWIRSSEPLGRGDLEPAGAAFRWLVDYHNWQDLGGLLVRDMLRRPVGWALFALGWFLLVFNQARLRRRLGQLSEKAAKSTCKEFSITAHGLLVTLLIAAPVPFLLLFFAWRIDVASGMDMLANRQNEFAKALAQGCWVATAILFPMELWRQICRPQGLGIQHFDWQTATAELLRINLRWLIDFAVPLAVVIGLLVYQSNPRWEASLGRMAFMALMPLLSVFLGRIFLPSRGILSKFIADHQGGWIDRLSFLWYPALVAGPLALAVVSLVGYHYTAQRIAMHLDTTLWTVVLLTVCYCLLKRWVVLNRRKLMIAQARARLEEAAKRDDSNALAPVKGVEEGVNLVAINEQTKRLLTSLIVATGLISAYFIWSDVLPAVSLLDNFPLWTVAGDLPEEQVTITLANLVLVIPIVVLVVIAARNVPGLLEIAFLQHLPLTNAARYAVTTLARYAIVALGIVVASSAIGLRWNSIQWLVAALGVGLGFGLQEIFANFVSGVILLFEQPIRVGDIITIDGTTGSVSKIRMRATTIVNWDRQELIVPNKELITGTLLNWTLTDTTNRVVLNVGVGYGSNIAEACELIRTVCSEHPNIMREPAPNVTFEGFGDNTLNLVLRAYLETLDHRLSTIHELHERIYIAFNDAGIEIAFPQRDLHLRTVPESLTRWLGSTGGRSEASGESASSDARPASPSPSSPSS